MNLGDISKINLDDLPNDIDLITHGSPCQDFSVAGLQKGGDKGTGTRSSLMWKTVDIVEKVKPKYVIWENVKNLLSKSHRHNFDSYIQVMNDLGYNSYYKVLNAKDYGIPQNRERVYTISILKDLDRGYEFPEGTELKLKLKDMLEDSVDEKYYLSAKLIKYFEKQNEVNKEKSRGFKFETTDGDCVAKTVTTRVGACRTEDNYIKVIGKLDIKGHDCVKRVYDSNGIAPTLTDMQGGNRQPKVIEINKNPKHQQDLVQDSKGLCRCIPAGTHGSTPHLLKTVVNECPLSIRKLTPKECWRLMGFDDEDFYKAAGVPTSNTQLYKQAGNSIVVNVLEAVFKEMRW